MCCIDSRSGTWTYTSLHDFASDDGSSPEAGVTIGSNGHIYGTTTGGGEGSNGVVFDITP